MSLPLVTASGTIKGGKLFIRARKRMDAALAALPDGEVGIEVFPHRAARTRAQDGYYFGVVLQALSDMSDGDISVSDWHSLLKAKFLSRTVLVTAPTGEIVEEFILGRSIRGLKTGEFNDYMEQIRRYAANPPFCLFIPDPDPLWREHENLEEPGYGAGV